MYVSADIAKRVKAFAKSKKMSISRLMLEAGLGENTLSNFNTSMPKADNLAKIADVLGCSVDYLLGRSDSPDGQGETLAEDEKKLIGRYRRVGLDGKEMILSAALQQIQIEEGRRVARGEDETSEGCDPGRISGYPGA